MSPRNKSAFGPSNTPVADSPRWAAAAVFGSLSLALLSHERFVLHNRRLGPRRVFVIFSWCGALSASLDLRWGRLHVNRAKGGIESVHPLHGPELCALRPLQGSGPSVFVTEAGTPTTTAWFLRMVQRGGAAKPPFPVHPHMLRHSTGISWPTTGTIRDRWRTISVTGICNKRRGTLRWLKAG